MKQSFSPRLENICICLLYIRITIATCSHQNMISIAVVLFRKSFIQWISSNIYLVILKKSFRHITFYGELSYYFFHDNWATFSTLRYPLHDTKLYCLKSQHSLSGLSDESEWSASYSVVCILRIDVTDNISEPDVMIFSSAMISLYLRVIPIVL